MEHPKDPRTGMTLVPRPGPCKCGATAYYLAHGTDLCLEHHEELRAAIEARLMETGRADVAAFMEIVVA